MCLVLPGLEHHSLLFWRLWGEAEKVRRGGEAGEDRGVKVVIIIITIIIIIIIMVIILR